VSASLAENLRTLILSDQTINQQVGSRVHWDAVPQDNKYPFIWFQRTGTDNQRCLGETTATPFNHTFAVEIVSRNPADVETLAPLVRAKCETLACGGTFGDTTVSNVFCEDQAGDYAYASADPNLGEHVAALSVEVYP
jgi:hypothetical protein